MVPTVISVKICCLLRYDDMQSGSLLPAFWRNMLYLSKDRITCPEDGGSRFLHAVVNKQLEITPFHIPEESNYELINFANHIFILFLMWWLFYTVRGSILYNNINNQLDATITVY